MADLEFIPDGWKTSVVAILEREEAECILWTVRAFRDWQSCTSSAWRWEAYAAIASTLRESRIRGRQVFLPQESGETWAFGFAYRGTRLYCKICLVENRLKIKIISAHIPLKADDF